MQLTLKDNYIKYKTYSGLDVVTTPNLISKSMATSARSAGWFWRFGKRLKDGSIKENF